MGVITTGNFAKAIYPGINKWYGLAYKEHTPEYPHIFEKNTSSHAFEEEVGATGYGLAAVKQEGASITYDTQSQGFISRYIMVTYGLGFVVTREMYEDNLYPQIGMRRAKSLAFSMRQTKEVVGANVLNRGFDSNYTGGDGSPLYATDHPNVSGGTWSNTLETPADLSEEALEQAFIDIANFENDRGLKIAVRGLRLVIPAALEFEAVRILKSELRPGTDFNDINAIRTTTKLSDGYKVNHYLTDPNAWFIITDCPDGLKYFERRADDFDVDPDFDTENAKFKATGRYAFGWTDPRGTYGSPGA